jgi:hypothetical protein
MLKGRFCRDSSNRLTFEVSELPADQYAATCRELAGSLRLMPASEQVSSYDCAFRDYTDGARIVGLEWDIWSGFIIVAQNVASESLVEELSQRFAGESPGEVGRAGAG